MTEYKIGKRKTESVITLPIYQSSLFEIGSYYTIEHKFISTRNNRIRWVSDKIKRTFTDMLCVNIEYNKNIATIYFDVSEAIEFI